MNSPHTIAADEAISHTASRNRVLPVAPPAANEMSSSLQQALELLCALTPGTQCGVIVTQVAPHQTQAEGPLVVAATWPRRAASLKELEAAAASAWNRNQTLVTRASGAEQRRVIIAQPIAGATPSSPPSGASAIAVTPVEGMSAEEVTQLARRTVQWISLLTRGADPEGLSRAVLVLEVLARLLSQPTALAAARACANELATRFGCERVAIAVLRVDRLHLLCMTPAVASDKKLPLVSAVFASMHEAIDQRVPIMLPAAGSDKRITLAHEQLLREGQSRSAMSIPFGDKGRANGAVTLERASTPFEAATLLTIETLMALAGPVLVLKDRLQAPWRVRLRVGIREALAPSVKRLGGKRSVMAGAAVAALLALAIPVDYRVSADARVEGAIERTLSAPTDGFIRKVQALPGDKVKAGDLIVVLDEDDAALEVHRAEGELAQADNAYNDAVAKQDRAGLAIQYAKRESALAQLALAKANLSRLRIVAPFDGTLTDGDLSRAIGNPVKRGDSLIKLMPGDNYRVTLKVDERDVGALAVDAKGGLTLASRAGEVLPIAVTRITPVSSAQDGRNVFEVSARLENATELRPGLEGVARIDAGRHAIGWILSHRVIDWLRVRAFGWWG